MAGQFIRGNVRIIAFWSGHRLSFNGRSRGAPHVGSVPEPAVRSSRSTARRAFGRPVLLGVAVVLVALNLRPAITSVGPVLDQARASFAASAGWVALLTTVPVLCLAGATLGFALTPLLGEGMGGWRPALGSWAGIGAVALVGWLAWGRPAAEQVGPAPAARRSLLTSPLEWTVTASSVCRPSSRSP
jgi:cyanate permease